MARLPFKQRCAASAVAFVLGLQTSSAQAEELATPQWDKVRVEYTAPPECPDAEAFKRLVGSRVPTAWEAAPGEFARRVVVQVSAAEGRYAATVELADERGELGVKTVTGVVCDSVVDGIALVTALAIQSRELEDLEPGKSEVTALPATEPAPPIPPRRNETEATARLLSNPPSPTAVPPRSPLGVRLSLRAAVASGIAPNAAPGAALGIVLEPHGARLGLTLQAFRTGREETRGVPARFELLSARLEGCPFVLVLASWASLEPCPFVELGRLSGEASERPPTVIRGLRGSAPWYSLGGLGRLVGHWGRFVLEVEGRLGVPMRRERFYVERGDEVHRVPAYHGSVAAGMGVRF